MIDSGINIICDRYAYSGIAFSCAKGLDLNWCKKCEEGLPEPDVIFYFEVDE